MRNFTIVLCILMSAILSGCGKSPLFNKLETGVQEVTGGIFLSERFPSTQREFSLTWIVPPGLENLSSFNLELTEALKDNQTINAYIWMPEMGHGSSPFEVKQENSLLFNFSEIAFIMPGLWVLHIEIIENNTVVDEWQKSFTL